MFPDPEPKSGHTFQDFPVGTRVKVIASIVDFFFFRGDTGTVVRNSGEYLGIMVKLDIPHHIETPTGQRWIKKDHGFNPDDLEYLETMDKAQEFSQYFRQSWGDLE